MDIPHLFAPKTQEALGRTLDATRKAMAEARGNLQILEEGRGRAEKRIESLKKELAETQAALSQAIAAKEERSAAERTRADECAAANATLDDARGTIQELETRLDDISCERDALAQKARELERVLDEVADLERQLAETASAAARQEEAAADLERQLNDARSASNSTKQALDAEKAGAAALQTELAAVRRTLDDQRSTHERLLAERDAALAQSQRELEDTRNALQKLSGDAATLQEQVDAASARNQGLTAQLEEAGLAREALEASLARAEEQADTQSRENAARIASLEADLAESQETVAGLNAQLASEAELRNALEVDLDVARKAIEELKQALTEAEEKVSPLL